MQRFARPCRILLALALVCGVTVAGGMVAAGGRSAPGVVVPPGYTPVPGSPDAVLRPSHRGSVGSTFTQDCSGLPIPLPPTGVVWHFILPQNDRSLYAPTPDNIFVDLTVQFASAGTVRLTSFGPPSAAHAWIATPTDDVLLDGFADGAERNGDGFPPLFNLSHTCAAPGVTPPVTTTTTTTTTTTPPSLGQFTLTKSFSGAAAGGQGPVRIEIECSPPNGPIPDWDIPAGATGVVSTVVTGVTTPAQCLATETETGENESVIVTRGTTPGVRRAADLCPVGVASPRALNNVGFDNVVDPRPSTTTTVPDVTEPSYPSTTAPATTAPPVVPPDECEVPEVDPTTTTVAGTISPPPPTPATTAPIVVPPTLPSTGGGSPAATIAALTALALGTLLVASATRRRAR